MSDLIKREDAIKVISNRICDNKWVCECVINSLPSAESVPQSEQYKKGFEDAKRAFELEFAREAESIVKRNAQLEVMFNIQKELLAERDWIPVSERLPDELAAVNITWVNHNPPPYYKYTKDVPLVDSAVYYRGKWYWWDATVIDLLGEYDGAYIHGIEPIDKDIEVVAWMPSPKPYREENEE